MTMIAHAADLTWVGPANGNWFAPANWSGSGNYPQGGDNVAITNGSVLLTNSSAILQALSISNATLVCSNWTTALIATNVTIRNQGTVTVPNMFTTNQMSNRVWIVCTNLAVNRGGSINVDGKGYAPDNGPGADGDIAGGGYGGKGGAGGGIYGTGGNSYGAPYAPLDPGSGAGRNTSGAGGGAIRIEAAGDMTVDGTITANGVAGQYASGSGGGIYITCGGVFSGSTSGVIRANSVNASYGAGGGGRIALICPNMVRENVLVRFGTRPGASTGSGGPAGMGTLYLSDTNLLGETISQFDGTRLVIPGFSRWSVTNLTILNSVVALEEQGFVLQVTNDLTITGGGLTLGGLAVSTGITESVAGAATNPCVAIGGNLSLLAGSCLTLGVSGTSSNLVLNVGSNAFVDGGVLTIGGTNQESLSQVSIGNALGLTNGGVLRLYTGVTNAGTTNYGALLAVTGQVSVGSASWIYPHAHPTNGGPVLIRAGALTIAANGGINADGRGYAGILNADGLGPGKGVAGNNTPGAGHGGRGGKGGDLPLGGAPYGSTNAPVTAGSSAGGTIQAAGGNGGGAVRIDCEGPFVLDGMISANGMDGGGNNYRSGGGAGGAVFINCSAFSGTSTNAILAANGGRGAMGNTSSYQSGGGAGGRISVAVGLSREAIEALLQGSEPPQLRSYSNHAAFAGRVSVTGGVGVYVLPSTNAAETGTRRYLTTNILFTVVGAPGAYGKPAPDGYGTTPYPLGVQITNSVVTPADQAYGVRHASLGWTLADEGGAPITNAAEPQAVCTLSTNLVLTWHWTNEYELTVAAVTNGIVNSNTVNGWYTNGTIVEGITASPTSGYAFLRWIGDVPAGSETNNPLSATMDRPRALTAAFYLLGGETKRWNGNGNWYASVTNWSPANPPGPADAAIIQSGTTLLAAASAVASLVVSNNAVIVFTNWDTVLTAGSMSIRSNAALTLPAAFTNTQMSNRIFIVCDDLTVDAGGRIDADGKGHSGVLWAEGLGPGKGLGTADGSGAGHGGKGGRGNVALPGGVAYDSTNAPTLPGSSGGGGEVPGGSGGGAVRIDASGKVVMNGVITANGLNGGGSSWRSGGGSGGSIFINCASFVGTSTVAALRANGGNGTKGNTSTYQSGGGGGGRIAVWFDVPADRFAGIADGSDMRHVIVTNRHEYFTGELSATNGIGYTNLPPDGAEQGSVVFLTYKRPGTMIFIQ